MASAAVALLTSHVRPNRIWTREEDAALRRMFASGLSFGLIASHLAMTRNQVMGRVYRLGLEREGGTAFDRRRAPRRRQHPEGMLLVSLIEVAGCRWPVEEMGGAHLFCGLPITGGSYCPAHRRWAYAPKIPTPR